MAERQYGVFSAAQAAAAGVSRQLLSGRVKARRLHVIHRGVFSLVPLKLLPVRGRRMAAVLAGGPGAALSHRSAAIHTGFLSGATPRRCEVSVPTSGGRSRSDVLIHRMRTLRPQDVVAIYGIPTTTVSRTILDLTGELTRDEVEALMEEAGRQELLDLTELSEQVAHNHGRPEAARLGEILDFWRYLWSFTDTRLETMLLEALVAAALPQPECQAWIDLGDGGPRIRADFFYRKARLILEADSWRWHAHRLEHDSRRDQRAAAAGFQTLRITRRQVVCELDRVLQTVQAVHAQRLTLSV